MSVVPVKIADYLAWAEIRAEAWQANPAAIGLTAPQAAAMGTAVALAQQAYGDKLKADIAARNATALQNDLVRASRRQTADLIRLIRGFAANSADPVAVYNAANLPEPAVATPLPPPGRPTDISVGIDPTSGAITLAWKVVNPVGSSGTAYIVRRRTSTTGAFTFIGVTGSKNYTDESFIAGPDSVQYTVQAQRAGVSGIESAIVTINFGRVGLGLTVTGATLEPSQSKLAA